MTIDKAIEYLDIVLKAHPHLQPGDFGQAVQLGKEALKRIRNQRVNPDLKLETLLLGETKD